MSPTHEAQELLHQLETQLEGMKNTIIETDYALDDLKDMLFEGGAALEAHPRLLNALRAAEYALRLAHEVAPITAPSPNPALLPPSEPRREIELALKQVTAVLNLHLT